MSHVPPIRALLADLGYAVRVVPRADAVTLLLRRDGERWRGEGTDEADALDDALAQALPSHLGWSLLRWAVPDMQRVDGGDVGDAALIAHEPATEVDPEETNEPVPAAAPAEAPAPGPAEPAEASEARAITEPGPESPPEADPEPAPELGQSLRLGADAVWPGAPETPYEAEAQLGRLKAEVKLDLDELATEPADHQRLQLTAWMAWARAIEGRFPEEPPIYETVSALASFLGKVAKQWWPGVVEALFIHAAPCDVGEELGLAATPGTAMAWHQVAEHAERLLAGELAPPDAFCPLLWADESQPCAPAPDAELARAVRLVRGVLRDLKGPPPRWADVRDDLRLDADAWAQLTEAARRLRWSRDGVSRPKRWAQVWGRLRWLACQHGHPVKALVEALDPATRPHHSWAHTLGIDLEAERGAAERAQLVREARAVGPETAPSWLERALATDGKWLSVGELAGLVQENDALRAALAELVVEDRGVRRRQRKVSKALKHGLTTSVPEPVEPCDAPETCDEPALDPHAELAGALRPHTEGKRGLVVSNRQDPGVRAELERLLGLQLEGRVATPRRTDAACEAIAGGSYDFVLCATGFIGHSTEHHLRAAAKGTETVMVRAYKARVGGCLRAMARELGVRRVAQG